MSFTNSTSALVTKGKKACYDISRSLNSVNCYDLTVFTKLFDSKVQPILSYASELWGMEDLPNIEQVHTLSLKRFLNLSVHSSNTLLYGDTGRYPLHINNNMRCIKYWFKLLGMSPERLARQAYDMLFKMDENGTRNWVTDVRMLLCANGFGYVWLFKSVGNLTSFYKMFKERLCDNFKQNWRSRLLESDNFSFYSSFKSSIVKELFLSDKIFERHLRNALIRFRLGVSQIHCHMYKFNRNNNLLICPICHVENKDECQFCSFVNFNI